MNTEDITKVKLKANLKVLVKQLNDAFEDADDEWVSGVKLRMTY